MEETLWRIFENIKQWLEYAEKKNSLILTFIGIQLTLVRLFIEDLEGLSFISFLILLFCLVLAIISFFPKTAIPRIRNSRKKGKKKDKKNDSLIFYGDIAEYTKEEYIEAIEKYYKENISENKYFCDICGQIIVDAKITLFKFRIFKISTWFMGVGQLLFFLSLL